MMDFQPELWSKIVVSFLIVLFFILRSNGQHSSNDIVDVVQCIDYPYPYFSRMFLSSYPECNNDEYRYVQCIMLINYF